MPTTTGGTPLTQYDFTIGISGNHVVISGPNGGSIRDKAGKKVTFTRATDTPRFKIECSYFGPNDGGADEPAWPFEEAKPDDWVVSYEGKLKKPAKGAPLMFYKYTIVSEDQSKQSLDPIIIIEY